ncbi:MAG: hypothetical protein ACRCVN_05840 [Spirochaetia bacterium]
MFLKEEKYHQYDAYTEFGGKMAQLSSESDTTQVSSDNIRSIILFSGFVKRADFFFENESRKLFCKTNMFQKNEKKGPVEAEQSTMDACTITDHLSLCTYQIFLLIVF